MAKDSYQARLEEVVKGKTVATTFACIHLHETPADAVRCAEKKKPEVRVVNRRTGRYV